MSRGWWLSWLLLAQRDRFLYVYKSYFKYCANWLGNSTSNPGSTNLGSTIVTLNSESWEKTSPQRNLGLSASDLIYLKALSRLAWRTPNGMLREMTRLHLPESSLLLTSVVRSWMLIQHARCLTYALECFSSRRWTPGELSPLIRSIR